VSNVKLCCAVQTAFVVLAVHGVSPRSSNAEVLDAGVRKALEQNAQSLNPCTIRWERLRASDYVEEELLKLIQYKPTAHATLSPQKVVFMYSKAKFYVHFWNQVATSPKSEPGKWSLKPIEQDYACDGHTTFVGSASFDVSKTKDKSMLALESLDRLALRHAESILPADITMGYLYWAGYRLPRSPEEILEQKPSQALALYWLERGHRLIDQRDAEIGNSRVRQLTIQGDDGTRIIYVDAQRNYATVGWIERNQTGELVAKSECSDLVMIPGCRLYLPTKIVVELHTFGGLTQPTPENKVLVKEVYKADQASHEDIPESRFSLYEKYTQPGNVFIDRSTPGSEKSPKGKLVYTVPANPSNLDDSIARALNKAKAGGSPSWRTTAIILFNVLLLLVIVFITLKLKRSRKDSNKSHI
jgi:hypothetical protein